MKSKSDKKKAEIKPAKKKAVKKAAKLKTIKVVAEKETKDEEISAEHIKGLNEALESSDIGEPVTLKEFKKMAKKWSAK